MVRLTGPAHDEGMNPTRPVCSSHGASQRHLAPLSGRQNHLLAALQPDAWARCLPHLQLMELRSGQIVCEPDRTPAFAVFPITAVVSLMVLTRDGDSAEVAVVGNEGVVGLALFMGGNATPGQAVVQTSGMAWRLNALVLKEEIRLAGAALHLLLRYTQTLVAQVAQTAACNRHHSIDQQLCRRLLAGLDRSNGDELVVTQEALAHMLGVRREGVTAAALKLQDAGVIRYRRGHISVLDRHSLEQRACECYAKASAEVNRLLPVPSALLHPPVAHAQALQLMH